MLRFWLLWQADQMPPDFAQDGSANPTTTPGASSK